MDTVLGSNGEDEVIESQVSNWMNARCWGRHPPKELKSCSSLDPVRRIIPAASNCLPSLSCVIEICTVTGPRSVYGLLGAAFDAASGSELIVDLPISSNTEVYDSPLFPDERLTVGLPGWLANGIVDSVSDYAMRISHKAGIISFCYSAFSEIGSSESVFEMLAKCILDTTSCGRTIDTPTELVDTIRRHFL